MQSFLAGQLGPLPTGGLESGRIKTNALSAAMSGILNPNSLRDMLNVSKGGTHGLGKSSSSKRRNREAADVGDNKSSIDLIQSILLQENIMSSSASKQVKQLRLGMGNSGTRKTLIGNKSSNALLASQMKLRGKKKRKGLEKKPTIVVSVDDDIDRRNFYAPYEQAKALHAAYNNVYQFASMYGVLKDDTNYMDRQLNKVKSLLKTNVMRIRDGYEQLTGHVATSSNNNNNSSSEDTGRGVDMTAPPFTLDDASLLLQYADIEIDDSEFDKIIEASLVGESALEQAPSSPSKRPALPEDAAAEPLVRLDYAKWLRGVSTYIRHRLLACVLAERRGMLPPGYLENNALSSSQSSVAGDGDSHASGLSLLSKTGPHNIVSFSQLQSGSIVTRSRPKSQPSMSRSKKQKVIEAADSSIFGHILPPVRVLKSNMRSNKLKKRKQATITDTSNNNSVDINNIHAFNNIDDPLERMAALKRELSRAKEGVTRLNSALDEGISWVHSNIDMSSSSVTISTRTKDRCRKLATERLFGVVEGYLLGSKKFALRRWRDVVLYFNLRRFAVSFSKAKSIEVLTRAIFSAICKQYYRAFIPWVKTARMQRHNEQFAASIEIQKVARAFFGRRVARLRRYNKAAVPIQCLFRKMHAKERVAKRRFRVHQIKLNVCAALLTKFIRGSILISYAKDEAHHRRCVRSAIRIQKVQRGIVGRAKHRRIKEHQLKVNREYAEQVRVREEALRKQQAEARAEQERLILAKKKEAEELSSKKGMMGMMGGILGSGKKAKEAPTPAPAPIVAPAPAPIAAPAPAPIAAPAESKEHEHAVLKLQALGRGRSARKKVARRRTSVLQGMQNFFVQTKKKPTEEDLAAIEIQKIVRGKVGRGRAMRVKEEKKRTGKLSMMTFAAAPGDAAAKTSMLNRSINRSQQPKVELSDHDKAAAKLQALSRGRSARLMVEKKVEARAKEDEAPGRRKTMMTGLSDGFKGLFHAKTPAPSAAAAPASTAAKGRLSPIDTTLGVERGSSGRASPVPGQSPPPLAPPQATGSAKPSPQEPSPKPSPQEPSPKPSPQEPSPKPSPQEPSPKPSPQEPVANKITDEPDTQQEQVDEGGALPTIREDDETSRPASAAPEQGSLGGALFTTSDLAAAVADSDLAAAETVPEDSSAAAVEAADAPLVDERLLRRQQQQRELEAKEAERERLRLQKERVREENVQLMEEAEKLKTPEKTYPEETFEQQQQGGTAASPARPLSAGALGNKFGSIMSKMGSAAKATVAKVSAELKKQIDKQKTPRKPKRTRPLPSADEAVLIIQYAIRCALARRRVQARRLGIVKRQRNAGLLLRWAVVSIQKIARARQGRKRAERVKVTVLKHRETKKKKAVGDIQRWSRGIAGRKKALARKKEVDLERKMAKFNKYQKGGKRGKGGSREGSRPGSKDKSRAGGASNGDDADDEHDNDEDDEERREMLVAQSKMFDDKLKKLEVMEKQIKEQERKMIEAARLADDKNAEVQRSLQLMDERRIRDELEYNARQEMLMQALNSGRSPYSSSGPRTGRSARGSARGNTSSRGGAMSARSAPPTARSARDGTVELSKAPFVTYGGIKWLKLFDPVEKADYYYNERTQEAQWEEPGKELQSDHDDRSTGGMTDYSTDHYSSGGESGYDTGYEGGGGEWQEFWDEQAQAKYWYNYSTGEATWNKPGGGSGGGAPASARAGPNAADWLSYIDDASGQEYWYNSKTGETSW